MRRWIPYFILISTSISCEDSGIDKVRELSEGTYTGQFIRSSPGAKYAPSNVTLTLTADRFAGESDQGKYPAICNGTYKIRGRKIEFQNECAWTAEFDWTYILSGEFWLNVDGDKFEMTKYMDGQTDYYKLTLQ